MCTFRSSIQNKLNNENAECISFKIKGLITDARECNLYRGL